MALQPAIIDLHQYLLLGAILLVCGMLSILLKRNAVGILMGVELILNAANVNLAAFNRFGNAGRMDGRIFAVFVIILAVAEAAVALAIFLNFYNNFSSIDVEKGRELKG